MLIISQDLDDPEITKLVKEAKVPFRKLHLRHSKRVSRSDFIQKKSCESRNANEFSLLKNSFGEFPPGLALVRNTLPRRIFCFYWNLHLII